jgi:catechol 2,3-dioxygenase-like lactoylglutathione lyase family enzyme
MQRSVALVVSVALLVLALAVGVFVRTSQPSSDAEFAAPAPVTGANPPLRPTVTAHNLPIDAQVVFLYYEDLDAAAAFYGETLGLEKTYESDGAMIYRTSASSYVGLVAEGSGYHRVAEEKPVMVSLVTDGVDEWHARLRAAGVEILSEPADSERAPVRAFLVRDPGGYTIEFFRWLDR